MPIFDAKEKNRHAMFSRRALILSGGMGAVFAVLTARLYQLQIVDGSLYLMRAENNRISDRLLAPPRGRILDRFGVVLASNRRNYRTLIVPEQTSAGLAPALDRLAGIIPLSGQNRARILKEASANRPFVPIVVAENLAWEDFARLNLDLPYLEGVQPDIGETRDYPFGEELSHVLGLPLEGDAPLEITGLASLVDAGPSELSFVEGSRYARVLASSRAGLVIAPLGLDVGSRACLRSRAPYFDFARAIALLLPRSTAASGIHPTAVVGANVTLGPDVTLGAYAVVGDGCSIGARTRLHPHVTVYPGVVIGSDCEIHSGVALREGVRMGDRVVLHNGAVIGSEGFGFAHDATGARARVPHRCGVIIEDDVEIGANSTIDASHPGHEKHGQESAGTHISRGVKIDNQVQVGHGCFVGEHSTLCAQVGLAGSTWIGRQVYMLGQAGAKGHVRIGDRSVIGGATGVTADVPDGAQILGVPPGVDRRLWGRIVVAWKRLPELLVRVRDLEKRLGKLDGSDDEA